MATKNPPTSQDQDSTPGLGPDTSPDTRLLDKRLAAELDKRGIAGGGGGGHMGGMFSGDERLGKLESEIAAIKAAMDWGKSLATLLCAVVIGGFALLVNITLHTNTKVDGISGTISEEFRAQRLEQAAQVSAISNAITATKQQAPQVLLVPAPAPIPQQNQPPKH